MRDKPFFAPRPVPVPINLYPLHCAHCKLLTGMLVQPTDSNWRTCDCSHCGKQIHWKLASEHGIHIIEKSTETGQVYVTGSPLGG